jgi:hypothetical protein
MALNLPLKIAIGAIATTIFAITYLSQIKPLIKKQKLDHFDEEIKSYIKRRGES